jgi:flagellar biosynthesis/type III secretory pathway M-ring protein FliF/YscJ
MGWWLVVRPFAPWVAVLLVLVLAFQCGSSREAKKSHFKISELELKAKTAERDRDTWKDRHEQLKADLDASNERAVAQAEEYAQRVEQMSRENTAELARLSTSLFETP